MATPSVTVTRPNTLFLFVDIQTGRKFKAYLCNDPIPELQSVPRTSKKWQSTATKALWQEIMVQYRARFANVMDYPLSFPFRFGTKTYTFESVRQFSSLTFNKEVTVLTIEIPAFLEWLLPYHNTGYKDLSIWTVAPPCLVNFKGPISLTDTEIPAIKLLFNHFIQPRLHSAFTSKDIISETATTVAVRCGTFDNPNGTIIGQRIMINVYGHMTTLPEPTQTKYQATHITWKGWKTFIVKPIPQTQSFPNSSDQWANIDMLNIYRELFYTLMLHQGNEFMFRGELYTYQENTSPVPTTENIQTISYNIDGLLQPAPLNYSHAFHTAAWEVNTPFLPLVFVEAMASVRATDMQGQWQHFHARRIAYAPAEQRTKMQHAIAVGNITTLCPQLVHHVKVSFEKLPPYHHLLHVKWDGMTPIPETEKQPRPYKDTYLLTETGKQWHIHGSIAAFHYLSTNSTTWPLREPWIQQRYHDLFRRVNAIPPEKNTFTLHFEGATLHMERVATFPKPFLYNMQYIQDQVPIPAEL